MSGRPILSHGDDVVDLKDVASVPDDLRELLRDDDARRQVRHIEKGRPPQKAVVPARAVRFEPPVDDTAWALRGGIQDDVELSVQGADGRLPAGEWSTGVAAIVDKKKVVGYSIFHRVGSDACLGPWMITADTVPDPRALVFAAFVDDMPVIRPAKALLDWESEANQNSLVCLATPPKEATGEVRCALSLDGKTLVRLVAKLA